MAENVTKTQEVAEVVIPTKWDILISRLTGLSASYYSILAICRAYCSGRSGRRASRNVYWIQPCI